MLDLNNEEGLSFSQAARLIPAINGKRTSAAAVARWAREGFGDIRLDSVRIGGRRVTTRQALEAFLQKVAAADTVAGDEIGCQILSAM